MKAILCTVLVAVPVKGFAVTRGEDYGDDGFLGAAIIFAAIFVWAWWKKKKKK